jgi:hypothetical protein
VVLYHLLKLKEPQDTIKTDFLWEKSKLRIQKSIVSAYKYDPVTDRYVYTNSVDGFQLPYNSNT